MSDHEYVEGESVVTDDEIKDFINEQPTPSYHTILEVWRTLLSNAPAERGEKVVPGYAQKLCNTYSEITYSKVNAVHERYFDKIEELSKILDIEIEGDEHCLSYTEAEEDVAENSHHYKNLLLQWQLAFVQWEMDWNVGNDDAAIELAAMGECHQMFFGATGITAFLDNIKFRFDDGDQAEMAAAITEMKAGA